MKIAYVDFYKDSKSDKSTSGVERKIASHIKQLKTLGDVTRHSYDSQSGGNIIKYIRMVTRRLPFFPSKIVYSYDASYDDLDAMYFRKTLLDSFGIRFFRDIKKHNPNCKIVLEIPTFPYDKEMSSLIEFPRLIKDRWNRRKLKFYVDRIVTFSQNEYIFNIPTIRTMNGLDFDTVTLRKSPVVDDSGVVHAIMVANFAPWHGLARLIDSMRLFYNDEREKKFVLHVVGAGDTVDREKKRIENTLLESYVVFHGKLFGERLDRLYDEVTLAIDTCDDKYQGVAISSSLKTREYVAKGLPVVGAMTVDLMQFMPDYFYRIPDGKIIDIQRIIDFHDTVYGKNESREIAMQIRATGRNLCDSSVVMEPVLSFFRNSMEK